MANKRNPLRDPSRANGVGYKASTAGKRGTAQGTFKDGRVISTSKGQYASKSKQRYNIQKALAAYELDENGNLRRKANADKVP